MEPTFNWKYMVIVFPLQGLRVRSTFTLGEALAWHKLLAPTGKRSCVCDIDGVVLVERGVV